MKEYVILFVFLLIMLLIAPLAYLNSVSVMGNTPIEATSEDGVKILITSSKGFLYVSKVDSKLREDLGLPDLFIIPEGKGGVITVELRGRCISACDKVDTMYLYYLTEDKVKDKRINLTIRIEPTQEATIFKDNMYVNKTDDIIKEAKKLGINVNNLKDLVSAGNREKLLKGIFGEYILPYMWILSEPKLESLSTKDENTTRGMRYIIEGRLSARISEVPPIIEWKGIDVRAEKVTSLTLSPAELEQKPYPYLFLSAFYRGRFLDLSGREPKLGYINRTGELREVLESYYRWLLQGRNSILGNYTGMWPGLWVQKLILGFPDWYSLNAMEPEDKRLYIEPHVDPILRGEEKPKDLTGKMFLSAVSSWFVDFIFVFLVLFFAIRILKRAR
jgi:hypothetical protein